jgi:hypothetical protein
MTCSRLSTTLGYSYRQLAGQPGQGILPGLPRSDPEDPGGDCDPNEDQVSSCLAMFYPFLTDF